MGSATSIISPEPVLAAAAVAGALGYGYVHYVRPAQRSDDVDDHADASASKAAPSVAASLHRQKKRGRKLQLPGDATLKNLDVLEAPSLVLGSRSASTSSAQETRQRQRRQPTQPPPPTQQHQQHWEAPAAQPQEVIPGGFDDNVYSAHDPHDTPQDQQTQPQSQQQQQQGVSATAAAAAAVKKPKKKKGRKVASATPSDPSSSPLATSTLTEGSAAQGASVGKGKKVSAPASAAAEDAHDERWTRVEARKKKASALRQDDAAAASGADLTTSDAGITTSVTGNSSPVTERTTEDELPSELDESTLEVSAVSLQGAPPRVVPVRPLPGEQPAKGFSWEDYEGVQVDEDASDEEEGGWGVVRSRRKPNKTAAASEGGTAATSTVASQSQPLTKKQRQNAQRREALKEMKREREVQQQATFTVHKRELERARAAEQAAAPKRTGSRFDTLG